MTSLSRRGVATIFNRTGDVDLQIEEGRFDEEMRDRMFSDPLEHAFISNSETEPLLWLLRRIRNMAGASHALIGELCGAGWSQVETVVIDTVEGTAENFRYDLVGTPCEQVVGSASCVFPSNVARLFPEDVLLEQMGIESYVGIPIHDSGGRPLGLMILLDTEPMGLEKVSLAITVLRHLEERVRHTLTIRRRSRDVNALLQAFSRPDGRRIDDVQESLLGTLAETLMARSSFLALIGERGRQDEAGVLFIGNQRIDGGVRLTEGALGELVASGKAAPRVLPSKMVLRPVNDMVSEEIRALLALESHCLTIPLYADGGRLIGVAGVIHPREMNPRLVDVPIVQAFQRQLGSLVAERRAREKQRLAEEGVKQLERLESLGVLAGGIAHDFNNILVGVLGNSDYLLGHIVREDEGELSESLRDIRDAALSAQQLCLQLMQYAGQVKTDPKLIDLTNTVRELCRLGTSMLGVDCQVNIIDGERGCLVLGDDAQIRRVLMNLLTNARDAIAPGGTVALELGRAAFVGGDGPDTVAGRVDDGQYARISVVDDGVGMPPEQVRRIFEPFFSTKKSGHGLGLSGTLKIVKNHHGWLHVASREGQGTRFDLYLPLAETSSVRTADVAPVSSRELGSKCVLIVDDDARVRRLLARFCKRAGLDCLVAAGGMEAVAIYRERAEEIGAILLDLNMPDLDGRETQARMRQIHSDVPIIISSGNLPADSTERTLPKPYRFESFVAAIAPLFKAS